MEYMGQFGRRRRRNARLALMFPQRPQGARFFTAWTETQRERLLQFRQELQDLLDLVDEQIHVLDGNAYEDDGLDEEGEGPDDTRGDDPSAKRRARPSRNTRYR
jgi:hypothetical protein